MKVSEHNFMQQLLYQERVRKFVEESNRIEGIYRDPTQKELDEAWRFINLDKLTIKEVKKFVKIYQPDAELRDKKGLDVYVGDYVPPAGDITIRTRLEDFLKVINESNLLKVGFYERLIKDNQSGNWEICRSPFQAHKFYESLHPFTDGNGRSGRIIWLWQMLKLKKSFPALGFLHTWYYQSLEN